MRIDILRNMGYKENESKDNTHKKAANAISPEKRTRMYQQTVAIVEALYYLYECLIYKNSVSFAT